MSNLQPANMSKVIPMPQRLREQLQNKNGTSSLSVSIDPMERLQRKCEAGNRLVGSLTGLDCPECKNRGYIWVAGDDASPIKRECACMVKRRVLKQLDRSGLKNILDRYTFDRWQDPEPWQTKALDVAKKYAAEPKGWFVVTGRSGTGKTHLCTAVCGELLKQGMDVRYMLWRDVAVRAKAVVTDDEEYSHIIEPLKRVKVLYIDDLFKTGRGWDGTAIRPTGGDINLAFELINARYLDSAKITIISSEVSILDMMDIDEATGGRIYEGAKSGIYLDLANRPNWRLR